MNNFIEKSKNNRALNIIGVIIFWSVVAVIAWVIYIHHHSSSNTSSSVKTSSINATNVTSAINAFRENNGDRPLTTFSLLSKMSQAKVIEIYSCGVGNNCGPGLDFNSIFNKDVGNPNGVLSILVARTSSTNKALAYWIKNNFNTLFDPNDGLIGVNSTSITSQPELVVMLYNPN